MKCPECKSTIGPFRNMEAGDNDGPKPNDRIVCTDCLTLCIVCEDGKLRVADQKELTMRDMLYLISARSRLMADFPLLYGEVALKKQRN